MSAAGRGEKPGSARRLSLRSSASVRSARAVLVPAAAVALSLLAVAAAVRVCGKDPGAALTALALGAAGDPYAISETLVKTVPLLFTGLSVALAFTAGLWNIGAEGQLLAGALLVTWAGNGVVGRWGVAAVPVLLALAFAAGAAWALVPVLLREGRGVQEVISTILLNFVAVYLVSYAVHGPLQERAREMPYSDPLPPAAHIPPLVAGYRAHWGLPLGIAAAVGLYLLVSRSVLGYRIRAFGRNRRALDYAGVDTRRVAIATMLLSGGLAGLAGGVEVMAVTQRLYEDFSPGWGYTAIVVALLARLNPLAVIATALFFGALGAGSNAMQREAGVPEVLATLVQAVILFFLAAWGAWSARRRES